VRLVATGPTVRRMFRFLGIFIVVVVVALGGAREGMADDEMPVAAAIDSRLAGDEKRTRFVVDLDRYLDFHVFVLVDPYRVVLDLPQTDFQFADGAGETSRGLVSAYRYGRYAPGKSRIVLDTTGPVEIDRAFTLEAQDDQPARLVVDLVESDRSTMLAATDSGTTEDVREHENVPGLDEHTAVPPGAGSDADDIVIVIDPGHGGIDSGAVSNSGVKEKDIVLSVGHRLKDALEESGQFEVHLTRENDIFVPLAERVRFAREKRASLFISLHADSVSTGSVSGASVYTLSERASDAVAAALAEQENRSDALAGVELAEETNDVVDILLDLVRRETKNHAVFFARSLVESLREDVALVRNPLRSAGFRVLRAHDVPSVLLELGYLTNTRDEKLLTDDEWQDRVSERVADAVLDYFGERHARGPF
jgi:N-acetylmuramoyl-L-alanine amidase